MKRVVIGLTAVFLLSTAPAFADDYIALCKATEQGNATADKLCTCASGKVKPADRAAAMVAMKATADIAAGKSADMSSADVAKGMQAQMEAESQCM
jgi:hypothetical protein